MIYFILCSILSIICIITNLFLKVLLKKLRLKRSRYNKEGKETEKSKVVVGLNARIHLIGVLIVLNRVLVLLLSLGGVIIIVILLFLSLLLVDTATSSPVSTIVSEGEKLVEISTKVELTYDYMSIDWSQDFSDNLRVIENNYGKVDRDWAELVILSMNTQQNQQDANVPVQGYSVGAVVVESSGGDFMKDSSAYPTTGYSSKNMSKGVSHKEGGNPPNADGVFQITTSGWTKYNTLYSEQSASLSPPITEDTPWYTMRYYCPTVVYGTLSKYNNIVNSTDYSFSDNTGVSSVERAFSILGVQVTNGKLKFIKNACMSSYCYASLVRGCYGDRENAKSDLATNIAMFVVMYCETYLDYDETMDTYHFSERSFNLCKSIINKNRNNTYTIGVDSSFCKAIYGTTSKSVFSEKLSDTSEYGVLDIEGNIINGTLDGYLYSLFPESAVDFFSSTCTDTMDIMSNTNYKARCYYDLTLLLASNYALEQTVDMLGLRVRKTSNFVQCAEEMAMWYTNNVSTYCSDPSFGEPHVAKRTFYPCSLLNGVKVGDDCSSYVTAVCAYSGIMPNYTGEVCYRSSNFKQESGLEIIKQLQNNGFSYYTVSSDWMPTAGDIAIKDGHIEIIAYVDERGVVYAYTWGANYYNSSANPNGGEPQRKMTVQSYIKNRISYWRQN